MVAQKFTVDPRLLSAVLTNSNVVYNDDADTSDDEQVPKDERAALKERLAREYEEEMAKECISCSS